jgi:hypothetical protein
MVKFWIRVALEEEMRFLSLRKVENEVKPILKLTLTIAFCFMLILGEYNATMT